MNFKKFKEEDGSQTIEFLMIIPAILLLVLCISEFGRAAYYKIVLESAIRDGANLAVHNAPASVIEDRIRKSAGNVVIDSIEITKQPTDYPGIDSVHTFDVKIRIGSDLKLKWISLWGLPEHLKKVRLEAEVQFPAVL